MLQANILIADDDPLIRSSLRERFGREGFELREAGSTSEVLARFNADIDLVLLDLRLSDGDGLTVLRRIKKQSPETAVIVMTAFSSVDTAVEAMKRGACHYVAKPFDVEEIALLAKGALDTVRLRREVRALRGDHQHEHAFDVIVGASPAVQRVKELLGRVAESPASSVLLTGETGTGKDLAAKAIHYSSGRAVRSFVNITCSAIPEHLLESELFGHERGAFTDARQQKKGLFEMADGGTLFLDEIGEMTAALQSKLLRFLEEKAFRRVGGVTDIRVDVRVVAATNRNLAAEVKAGKFREDLFYRLQVMPIELPPLRDRYGDAPLLALYFVDGFNREFKKHIQGLTPAANRLIDDYCWPGNIRELRNVIERAMLLGAHDWLEPSDLDSLPHPAAGSLFRLPAEGLKLVEVERQLVMQALERTGGNQSRAAALLGLHRDQVRYRIEKFGLQLA
ncbi:MAG TPA: sigma-54 dependent transcriptional regulator [Vicinamibacterales bacterium]|nr:sigma-54 dependent transcriptional regulator [Vicinamibacterales bacterium]